MFVCQNILIAFWIAFITKGIAAINIISNNRGFIPINHQKINQDNSGWKPIIASSFAQRSGRYYTPQIFQNNQPAITVPFVIKPKSNKNDAVNNVKELQSERRAVNVQKLEVLDSNKSHGNSFETKSVPWIGKSEIGRYKFNNNLENYNLISTVQALKEENIEVDNSWKSLLEKIDTKLAVLIKEKNALNAGNAPALVASKSNDTNTPRGKSHAIGRRISPHTEAGYDVPLILNSQLVAANKSTTAGDYRDSASKVRHVGNSLASYIDVSTPLSSALLSTFQTVDIPNDRDDNGYKSVARSYKREGDSREGIASQFMSLTSLGFNSNASNNTISSATVPNENTRRNNVNVAESVIQEQNQSYEISKNSEKTSDPNFKKLGDIFDILLHKYNVIKTDIPLNYDISRIPKDETEYPYATKFLDYKVQRYNSLNHIPPDPLAAVWLSQYGHYDPAQHGRASLYRNLYGYLASNNIHNNKPFASYKIFEDTDVK